MSVCGVGGHARGGVEGREGVYVGARRADGRKMQLRRGREMRRVEELLADIRVRWALRGRVHGDSV